MDRDKQLRDIGESGLYQMIRDILGPSSPDVWVGIGDDAAVVCPSDRPMVLTTDAMLEDVHFSLRWTTAADLAYKSLASTVSDLAAKGALPAYGLLTLGLSGEVSLSWIRSFYETLAEWSRTWMIALIGGDTIRSEKILVSITAIGYQPFAQPLCIHTACPGDQILVTGTVGDAAAGLEILQNEPSSTSPLVSRFQRPTPRLKEVQALLSRVRPTSMTDISDGLARDLPKLCSASRRGAIVHAKALPCSPTLRNYAQNPVAYAWRGGEDYELLFTLPSAETGPLLRKWDFPGCPLTRIGEITANESELILEDWDAPPAKGFDHFSVSQK